MKACQVCTIVVIAQRQGVKTLCLLMIFFVHICVCHAHQYLNLHRTLVKQVERNLVSTLLMTCAIQYYCILNQPQIWTLDPLPPPQKTNKV